MKIIVWIPAAVFVLFLSFPSCDTYSGDAEGDVELYLLESYENIDQSCAIEKSSITLEKHALIAYSDFKSYNSKKHIFKITSSAAKKVEELQHSVHGLAFAIVANEEVIYTAYFWPSYSSASCQWVVVDPFMMSGNNELHVQMGYPGRMDGIEIPDERNNEEILDIFRRDGKLID